MEELVATIRAAVNPIATAEAKSAGAAACRAILTVLEAEPGKPLVPPPPPATPMAAVVEQIRGAPPSLVLDALIAKLKSYLPADAAAGVEPATVIKIPFVPLPAAKKES